MLLFSLLIACYIRGAGQVRARIRHASVHVRQSGRRGALHRGR